VAKAVAGLFSMVVWDVLRWVEGGYV